MATSRRCEECGQVKRCDMHVVGESRIVTYVCKPCARKLGYRRSA